MGIREVKQMEFNNVGEYNCFIKDRKGINDGFRVVGVKYIVDSDRVVMKYIELF